MKLKIYTTFLLINLFSNISFSQSHRFEFAKPFGGSSPDYADAVITDNQGNIYTAGTFTGTVDFNPNSGVYNLTSPNGTYRTAFIQKLNRHGDFVWAKQFGATRTEIIGMEIDADGNIYITGNFRGSGDFNPGVGVNNLSSNGNQNVYDNIFLLKLDSDGQYQWVANFGGTTEDEVNDITIDNQDNIYLTGSFTGTSDFDPSGTAATILSAYSKDAFILKLDKNKNFQWIRQMPNSPISIGFAITNDDFGNIYVAGSFRDSVYCDANGSTQVLYSSGFYSNLFTLKIDTSNTFHWIKYVDNPTHVLSTAITTDSIGNIYTVGTYSGLIDLNPDTSISTITSLAGITNSFIQKLDSSGQFIWAKALQGTSHNSINDIEISEQGTIYTTGNFSGSADFDPNSTAFTFVITVLDVDVFIQSLDLDGNFLWARRIGNTYQQIGKDLHLDSDETIYLTGNFKGTVDLNPDAGVQMATAHNYDCFLVKFRPLVANDLSLSKFSFACDTGLIFRIHNQGINTIDSFEIGWSVNNVIQAPIMVYDSIVPSDSMEINQAYLFDSGITSQASAWIISVNGMTDALSFNDSATAFFPPPVPIEILDTIIWDVYIFMGGEIRITPSGDASTYSYFWNTGATTQNLTDIAAPGFYYLTITSSYGCADTFSFEVGFVTTEFVLNNQQIQLHLYPNPIPQNQLLTLEFDAILSENIDYQIVNIEGKVIQNGIFRQGNLQYQIPSPNVRGVYYLQLKSKKKVLKTVSFVVR